MFINLVFNFSTHSSNGSAKVQKSERLIKFLNNQNNKIINKKNVYILSYESYSNLETHNHYGFDNSNQIDFLENLDLKFIMEYTLQHQRQRDLYLKHWILMQIYILLMMGHAHLCLDHTFLVIRSPQIYLNQMGIRQLDYITTVISGQNQLVGINITQKKMREVKVAKLLQIVFLKVTLDMIYFQTILVTMIT